MNQLETSNCKRLGWCCVKERKDGKLYNKIFFIRICGKMIQNKHINAQTLNISMQSRLNKYWENYVILVKTFIWHKLQKRKKKRSPQNIICFKVQTTTERTKKVLPHLFHSASFPRTFLFKQSHSLVTLFLLFRRPFSHNCYSSNCLSSLLSLSLLF